MMEEMGVVAKGEMDEVMVVLDEMGVKMDVTAVVLCVLSKRKVGVGAVVLEDEMGVTVGMTALGVVDGMKMRADGGGAGWGGRDCAGVERGRRDEDRCGCGGAG